jgi:hypothetical protein
VCIGTVVEFVQYNTTATKTWRVIVYTNQNPGGVTVAKRTFTLNRGDYFWGFGVHRVFTGLTAVCLAADESFGMSCVHFSYRSSEQARRRDPGRARPGRDRAWWPQR